MNQIQLMQLVMSMKPGQKVHLRESAIWQATEGELSSRLFDSVRREDVKAFIAKISANWDVDLIEDMGRGGYVMTKRVAPEVAARISRGLVQWLFVGGPAHGDTQWLPDRAEFAYPDSRACGADVVRDYIYKSQTWIQNGIPYRVGCGDPAELQPDELIDLIRQTGLSPLPQR